MNEDFKGIWISKEILEDKNLSKTEKLLLSSIFALDNGQGCYATNRYFAKLLNLSKDRTSKIINNLVQKGYLKSEITYCIDTQEIEKRVIRISDRCMQKCREGICEHTVCPPGENNQEYNKEKDKKEDIKKENNKRKIFDETSDPYLLARLLETDIREHSPHFPESKEQRQRWAKDIDLMIRKDKLDVDDIAEVIEWCQQDSFWRSNILSGKKLREKYQQLSIRMSNNKR